jgi:RHS repeat-associated protein
VPSVASGGLHAYRAGSKLASREKSSNQGEGAFVIRAQARTTSKEKALRYDGTASGGTVNTYTWNARNQLTQISQNGNAQLSFAYDAVGRRTSKTLQGTATQFLYDGMNAVQETQGTTINPILVGLWLDERFARNDVTGRTYFLSDQLNSTIALTDPTGALKEQYSYDPYGNVSMSDTTTGFTNPYQYTGREADSLGLYYYRARYYSPQFPGFISEDPIGFEGGQLSFYAYVGGNPVSYTDPDGTQVAQGITVGGEIGTAIEPGAGTAAGGIVGGLIGTGIAIYAICHETDKSCPPCKTVSGNIVPVGTIGYRPLDVLPPDVQQHGVYGSHYNLFRANQYPKPKCDCFWQKLKNVASPGALQPNWMPIEPFLN